MSAAATTSSGADCELNGVHLAGHGPTKLFNIKIVNHQIHSITAQPPRPASQSSSPAPLLLPSLCHPHIHLDKAFLLTSHHTDRYADLGPTTGTFEEPHSATSNGPSTRRCRGISIWISTSIITSMRSSRPLFGTSSKHSVNPSGRRKRTRQLCWGIARG